MSITQLEQTLQLIDQANEQDPNKVMIDGHEWPVELLYGQRMSAQLADFRPHASEALTIAARAQHIERWASPRSDYPEGRVGYLRWRKDLLGHHATRTGELMLKAGYDADVIATTQNLMRKQAIKQNDEAQALEDVICLVFLEYYAPPFIAKYDDEKVIDILQKTAKKMSKDGLAAAMTLTLDARLARLIGEALA